MKIEAVVEQLQNIKESYPSLSKLEIMELMKIKLKMEELARGR